MKNLTRLTWSSLLLGLTLGTAAHALGGAGGPPPAPATPPCGLPAQSTLAGAAGAAPRPVTCASRSRRPLGTCSRSSPHGSP